MYSELNFDLFLDNNKNEKINKPNIVIVGASPNADLKLIKNNIKINDYVICADGGIEYLYRLEIYPDVWIGDFDSTKKLTYNTFDEYEKFAQNKADIIRLNPIKDETDFETVCIRAMNVYNENKNKFGCVKIFAALGNRCDHTLSNIITLKRFADNNIAAALYDEYNIIAMFSGKAKIKKNQYTYFSLIPIDKNNRIYADGVKYPLGGECLNPYTSRGISNEITSDTAYITTNVNTLLILSKD